MAVLPVHVDPSTVARKGLAQIRNRLGVVSREIVTVEEEQRKTKVRSEHEEFAAKLNELKAEESSCRNQIADAEKVLYGSWAPKRPPTPERMSEIRKAK